MTACPRTASARHHRIDLSPAYALDAKGRSSGHGKAVMTFRGEEIGTSSEPLFAAARFLFDNGLAEPHDMIATYRNGLRSMSAKIGVAAGRTVVETPSSGPRLGPYRPYTAPVASDGAMLVGSDQELVPA